MVFFPDEENKSKVVEGKATDSNKKDDSWSFDTKQSDTQSKEAAVAETKEPLKPAPTASEARAARKPIPSQKKKADGVRTAHDVVQKAVNFSNRFNRGATTYQRKQMNIPPAVKNTEKLRGK